MITEYGVLKPDVPRPAGPGQEAHEHWRQEQREKWPDWKPLSPEYNIRFAHDVYWRDRLFSVQGVNDAINNFDVTKPTHWFWVTIGALMLLADLMWYARVQMR